MAHSLSNDICLCAIALYRNTNMDVEFRIMKPNKKFELDVRDIEIIEQALRAKAGRRGMAIASGETSKKTQRRNARNTRFTRENTQSKKLVFSQRIYTRWLISVLTDSFNITWHAVI